MGLPGARRDLRGSSARSPWNWAARPSPRPPAWRVLETSHPPTYYLPRDAFFAEGCVRRRGRRRCEWKGQASYDDLVTEKRVAAKAAWSYLYPTQA